MMSWRQIVCASLDHAGVRGLTDNRWQCKRCDRIFRVDPWQESRQRLAFVIGWIWIASAWAFLFGWCL